MVLGIAEEVEHEVERVLRLDRPVLGRHGRLQLRVQRPAKAIKIVRSGNLEGARRASVPAQLPQALPGADEQRPPSARHDLARGDVPGAIGKLGTVLLHDIHSCLSAGTNERLSFPAEWLRGVLGSGL